MNKKTFLCICILFVNYLFIYGKDKFPVESLPNEALSFIKSTYPNTYIEEIKMDKGIYDLKLVNNVNILFTYSGIWTKVKSRYVPVPENILPNPIVNYIHANEPNTAIEDIEKTGEIYKILFFNRVFIRIASDGSILYRGIKH